MREHVPERMRMDGILTHMEGLALEHHRGKAVQSPQWEGRQRKERTKGSFLDLVIGGKNDHFPFLTFSQ